MIKDKLVKIPLIIIGILLVLNLFGIKITFQQDPALAAGGSGSITCSADGKYVYVVMNGNFYRADDYAKRGFKNIPLNYIGRWKY